MSHGVRRLLPPTSPAMNAVAVAALTMTALAACQSEPPADIAGPAATPSATATTTPTAAPEDVAATALTAAKTWSGTAVYQLQSRTGSGEGPTVRVERTPAGLTRVDVKVADRVSTLMPTATGWVACEGANLKDAKATCVTVAAAGAAVPAAFDPGLGAVFAQTLPALAAATNPTVTAVLPATATAGEAACVSDASGEYCVAEDGVLRRATFGSGSLVLKYAHATAAAAFTPPAAPTPLA